MTDNALRSMINPDQSINRIALQCEVREHPTLLEALPKPPKLYEPVGTDILRPQQFGVGHVVAAESDDPAEFGNTERTANSRTRSGQTLPVRLAAARGRVAFWFPHRSTSPPAWLPGENAEHPAMHHKDVRKCSKPHQTTATH